MNNEMQTWRPWTPEEKKLHEEAMERIQKLNEEFIKKGELDTINALRKQIRRDMKDYELLNIVEDYFPIGSKSNFLFRYLESQINNNTLKLKELVEDKND